MPGPPPKRSEQRRRTNQPEMAVTKAPAGEIVMPDADPDWHPYAAAWFASLGKSGQSVFYEQSDWETARIATDLISRQLHRENPSAVAVQTWVSMAASLLATEGDRRRLRLELQRAKPTEDEADVSELDEYRRRQSG